MQNRITVRCLHSDIFHFTMTKENPWPKAASSDFSILTPLQYYTAFTTLMVTAFWWMQTTPINLSCYHQSKNIMALGKVFEDEVNERWHLWFGWCPAFGGLDDCLVRGLIFSSYQQQKSTLLWSSASKTVLTTANLVQHRSCLKPLKQVKQFNANQIKPKWASQPQ